MNSYFYYTQGCLRARKFNSPVRSVRKKFQDCRQGCLRSQKEIGGGLNQPLAELTAGFKSVYENGENCEVREIREASETDERHFRFICCLIGSQFFL